MVYNVSFFRKKKDSDKFQNRQESRTGQKLGEIARFILDRICYLAGRPSRASEEGPSGLAVITFDWTEGKAISERTLAGLTIAQNGTCQIPTDK